MKSTINKDLFGNFRFFPLIFFSLISIVLISYNGVIFAPDSSSYISIDLSAGDIVRPSFYPLVVDVAKFFGGHQWANVMLWFQFSLGMVAIYIVAEWCQKFFIIPHLQKSLVYLILFFPYLIPDLRLGNTLASEALAYPLFLVFFKHLLSAFHNQPKIHYLDLLFSMILFTLLILTRKQFYFLIPCIILIPLLFLKLKGLKWSIVLIFSTLIFLALSISVERVANSQSFDEAPTGSPDIGMQFVVTQLYLSNESQINLMKTEKERAFFSEVHENLKKNGLTLMHLEESKRESLGLFGAFFYNYNPIFNAARKVADQNYSEIRIIFKRIVEADKLLLSVAQRLFLDNITSYTKLFIFNIVHGLGGNFSVGFSMPILFLLVFINHSWKIVRTKDDGNISVIFVGLFLLHLSNIFTVSIIEPTMIRYTFYTWSGVLLAIFLMLTCEVRKKPSEIES